MTKKKPYKLTEFDPLILEESRSPYGLRNPYLCSPMNYIGGKYKLLPQLLSLFPNNTNILVDLFCGGANVGINVPAKKVVFNDNLLYLIELYSTFCNQTTEEIINHIENRIAEYQLSLTNENGYKALRQLYNKQRNPLDLFVLVAYSFNHQIRFNNSHEFNNPFGRERSSFNPRMKSNLIAFVNRLQSKNASFTCLNFDDFDFSELTENDFVYADPPYLITTGTYNDGKRGFTGWNETQEQKLLDILSDIDKRGIKFALSNVLEHKGKSNDILHNWVNDNHYFVHHLTKNYSNSNYHTINRDKTATDEVLITNYQPQRQQLSLF